MDNLDREIRRLAREIRAVEQTLVEACGLTPVTTAGAGYASLWGGRVRCLCRWVWRAAAELAGSEPLLAVRVPQPD